MPRWSRRAAGELSATLGSGEQEAAILRQNAESEKQKMLADAEAEAIRLRGEGDAEAAKYYQVFKENPDLANWLRKCDAFRATVKSRAGDTSRPR